MRSPPRSAAREDLSGEWGPASRRRRSVLELALVEVAVVLDARDAQALHARTVDRSLPGSEFLQRQVVALEHFIDRQEAAVDRGHHLGLAPHDPPLGAGRR